MISNVASSLGPELSALYNQKPEKLVQVSSWSEERLEDALDTAVTLKRNDEKWESELPGRLAQSQIAYSAQTQLLAEQESAATPEQEQKLQNLHRSIDYYQREIAKYNDPDRIDTNDMFMRIISARSGLDTDTVEAMYKEKLDESA